MRIYQVALIIAVAMFTGGMFIIEGLGGALVAGSLAIAVWTLAELGIRSDV